MLIIELVKDIFNSKNPIRAVYPDESIAIGACYLANYLCGEKGFIGDTSKVKNPYSYPKEELDVNATS